MPDNTDSTEIAQPASEKSPSRIAPIRTKRHRRAVAAGAVLAVLSVGVGGVALHQHGVAQGRKQVSAPTLQAVPPMVSMRTDANAFCGGRFLVTVNGKRYLLVGSNAGGDGQLVDVDANRYGQCAAGAPDQSQTAQNLVGWDRDTQGCVRLAVIDGREWILSSGWGLIPANGRVPGTEGYGNAESERDDSRCRPTIRFGEKNPDGTLPTDPAPPTVPPVEDTRGYLVDSRVKCPWDDSRWERYQYVPTLGTCVPFATDGSGFKVRGDTADDPPR